MCGLLILVADDLNFKIMLFFIWSWFFFCKHICVAIQIGCICDFLINFMGMHICVSLCDKVQASPVESSGTKGLLVVSEFIDTTHAWPPMMHGSPHLFWVHHLLLASLWSCCIQGLFCCCSSCHSLALSHLAEHRCFPPMWCPWDWYRWWWWW